MIYNEYNKLLRTADRFVWVKGKVNIWLTDPPMQEEESASLPVTFDPPLRALWSGPSACPQAGSRVWCWPAGGAASGPPIVRSPAQEQEEEEEIRAF